MEVSDDSRKFLSDEARPIADKFTSDEKPERDEIGAEIDNFQDQENSVADKNISEATDLQMLEDSEDDPDQDEDELVASTTPADDGYVRDENGVIITDPRMAYIKKFEKFINFLQTTIKKVAKIVKEGQENNVKRLNSVVKDINIIWRSNGTMDNGTNVGPGSPANIATNLPTSTEPSKLTNASEAVEEKSPDANSVGYNSSESESLQAKKYKSDGAVPTSLKKSETKSEKLVKWRSEEKSGIHEERKRKKLQREYTYENDAAEHDTLYGKRYKADVRKSSQEVPEDQNVARRKHKSKFQDHNNFSESKFSVEEEDINSDETADGDDSDDLAKRELSSKSTNSGKKTSATASKTLSRKRVTNEHGEKVHSDIDSSEFTEIVPTTDEKKQNRKKYNRLTKTDSTEESVVDESGFPVHTMTDKEVEGYQVLQPKPMFSVDERITNEDGFEVHSRVQSDDFHILKSMQQPMEESKLLVVHKPTSSEEDDFFDETLDESKASTSESRQIATGSGKKKSAKEKKQDPGKAQSTKAESTSTSSPEMSEAESTKSELMPTKGSETLKVGNTKSQRTSTEIPTISEPGRTESQPAPTKSPETLGKAKFDSTSAKSPENKAAGNTDSDLTTTKKTESPGISEAKNAQSVHTSTKNPEISGAINTISELTSTKDSKASEISNTKSETTSTNRPKISEAGKTESQLTSTKSPESLETHFSETSAVTSHVNSSSTESTRTTATTTGTTKLDEFTTETSRVTESGKDPQVTDEVKWKTTLKYSNVSDLNAEALKSEEVEEEMNSINNESKMDGQGIVEMMNGTEIELSGKKRRKCHRHHHHRSHRRLKCLKKLRDLKERNLNEIPSADENAT